MRIVRLICNQFNQADSNDRAFIKLSVSFNSCIMRPFRREENIIGSKTTSASSKRSEWRNVLSCESRRAPIASSEQARPIYKPTSRNDLRAMFRFAPFVWRIGPIRHWNVAMYTVGIVWENGRAPSAHRAGSQEVMVGDFTSLDAFSAICHHKSAQDMRRWLFGYLAQLGFDGWRKKYTYGRTTLRRLSAMQDVVIWGQNKPDNVSICEGYKLHINPSFVLVVALLRGRKDSAKDYEISRGLAMDIMPHTQRGISRRILRGPPSACRRHDPSLPISKRSKVFEQLVHRYHQTNAFSYSLNISSLHMVDSLYETTPIEQ